MRHHGDVRCAHRQVREIGTITRSSPNWPEKRDTFWCGSFRNSSRRPSSSITLRVEGCTVSPRKSRRKSRASPAPRPSPARAQQQAQHHARRAAAHDAALGRDQSSISLSTRARRGDRQQRRHAERAFDPVLGGRSYSSCSPWPRDLGFIRGQPLRRGRRLALPGAGRQRLGHDFQARPRPLRGELLALLGERDEQASLPRGSRPVARPLSTREGNRTFPSPGMGGNSPVQA